MTEYAAAVRVSRRTQPDLQRRAEHCSADRERLATIGRTAGQQVRVVRGPAEFALYTVSETPEEVPDTVVRMGPGGRRRLDPDAAGFAATVQAQVVHPTFDDVAAQAAGELVERLDDDGASTDLIVIAPHGGDIEPRTDDQAERMAARLGATCWRCRGWGPDDGVPERWHITSVDLNPACFPLLDTVFARGFTHAVAFHGADAPGVLVGGAAPPALQEEIRCAVAATGVDVRLAGPDDPLGGNDRRNLVNRLTVGGANGLQLEQGPDERVGHWSEIADAVAEVYALRLASRSADAPLPEVQR